MNTTIKTLLAAGLLALVIGGLVYAFMQKNSNTSVAKLTDMKLTYVLNDEAKKLFNITVSAGSGKQEGYVVVNGKACNTMNSTIQIIKSGETTTKKVINTLNDGRQVIEPATVSTMMACTDQKSEHDDSALTAAISAIANSLQSY